MFVFVITDSSCQQFIGVNLLCCVHLLRDKQKKAWLKVQETNESLGINIEIRRCHDANFPVQYLHSFKFDRFNLLGRRQPNKARRDPPDRCTL